MRKICIEHVQIHVRVELFADIPRDIITPRNDAEREYWAALGNFANWIWHLHCPLRR